VGGDEVGGFIAALDHPLKAEIAAVRRAMLAADPAIHEGIKWNAPSFRTHEYFATVNLRSRDRVQVILHLGAKARKPMPELKIADPGGLVRWLARDRCVVTLPPAETGGFETTALQAIVRQWITYV
jgi:hypothetical protein